MNALPMSSKALAKIPFKNVDAQSAPAFAVMQVTGSIVEDGVTFLTCQRTTSALTTEFAVNGPTQVLSGQKGVCYRSGDLRIAFEGGSPAAGQRWGVKVDQWTLSPGCPSIASVHGVHNSANSILFGALTPIENVLGMSDVDLPPMTGGAPGTGTVTVYVWNGTAFAPADPPMYLVANNVSAAAIKAGTLMPLLQSDGQWIAHGERSQILVRFELTSDLNYGDSPSGSNAKVLVWNDADGKFEATGEAITVWDFATDEWSAKGSDNYGTWAGKGPTSSPARAGYQGWCCWNDDSAEYEIVWMEQQARMISFRLYERLSTGDDSQASCPVISFWDGRDPDPSDAGLTVYNLATDNSGVYKWFGEANEIGYAVWNEKLSQYQIIALEGAGRRWVLFKNVAGYSQPANAVMVNTGVTSVDGGHTNGRWMMTMDQPSTTFSRTYWVNGYADVPNGAVGVCFGTDGPVEVLFDASDGAPSIGEGWGAKPGQSSLEIGYPGFTILGVTDGFNNLTLAVQHTIDQLLIRTTADMTANNTSTDYHILAGLLGNELDGGWTVPTAFNATSTKIANGKLGWLTWTDNGWYAAPLSC